MEKALRSINEAIPEVADANKRARAAILLGNVDGSGPETDLGEALSGEHEIAEGGEELTGAPAIRTVPEEDGYHGGIGPSRTPAVAPEGRCSRTFNLSLAVTVRGEDWAMEKRWPGVSSVSLSEAGENSKARVDRTVSRE